MKMESSILAKKIIKQLDSNDRTDMLSRWMVYYITELMDRAKKADEKEKGDIEDKCASIIFELWKHRAYLPRGVNPLKKFDSIYNTLERINPDNPRFFIVHDYDRNDIEESENTDKIGKWLDMVETIDRMARSLIEHALNQAAKSAVDEGTKQWISTMMDEDTEIDIVIASKLLGSEEDQNYERNRQRLKRRIEQLEEFNELCEEIYKEYCEELADVE
ncbi:MAG: hypothetical protein AAGU75_10760 [Bacillota bacterium]